MNLHDQILDRLDRLERMDVRGLLDTNTEQLPRATYDWRLRTPADVERDEVDEAGWRRGDRGE